MTNKTMTALTVKAQRELAYEQVPIPTLAPDEVLCRVVYNGICGTDIVIYTGETNFVRDGLIKYPVRIGHEWSGVVAAVGSEITDFALGDRVVGDNAVGCGVCNHCRSGNFRKCKDLRSVGTINAWDGAYAEYMVMPARHLYRLPDSISLESGVLIEPMTVAYCGMSAYDITPETTVAIIGAGPIGMAALAVARAMGSEKITFIGRNDRKLEIARTLGASSVINSKTQNLLEEANCITGGEGFDIVVEASGAACVVQDCIDLAAQYGNISLLGFFEEEINHLILNRAVTKGLTIKGVFGGGELPQIIDFMEMQGVDLEPIITSVIPFEEAKEYIENADERKREQIKVLVRIGEA